MMGGVFRAVVSVFLLVQANPTGAGDEPGTRDWFTVSDPALLMYPMRFPVGWTVKPLSQPGISLLRVTAADGSAAMEVYTGLQFGAVDARGLARSAVANLLGGAEPEGAEVFRDERRTLTAVVGEIAVRGVLLGPRAAVAIAMTSRSGQTQLAHYRVMLAPKDDPTGLFDRLVAEHFADLEGPVTPK